MQEIKRHVLADCYIKEGLFKTQAYYVIVTDKRLVFAKLTKAIRKEEQEKLKKQLIGKSFKERMMAVMMQNQYAFERYRDLDISAILNETQGNFFILKKDIQKIKTSLGQAYDENHQPIAKRVKIITAQNKIELRFHYANQSDDAYRYLKSYINE